VAGSVGPPPDATTESRDRSGHSVWRWLFHATWGIVVVVALQVLSPGRGLAVLVLALVLLAQVGVEWLRLRYERINRLFVGAFRLLVLPVEVGTVASSTWYTAGVMAAVAVLPREAALSGILILALADPVASLVGQRWGRHSLLGGSWEGTVGFLVVTLGVLLVRHEPLVAILAAPIAALAERLSGRLDDNLVMPLASGAIVWVLTLVV
jgi:dolichol kinase